MTGVEVTTFLYDDNSLVSAFAMCGVEADI